MFLEVFTHAIALDFGFFIEFIIGNLFWVFAIYAIMHFFMNGKRVLYFTVLFSILLLLAEFESVTGLVWTSSAFLLLYYISKLAILALAENTPGLKKYVVILSTLQAWVLILVFNFFIK